MKKAFTLLLSLIVSQVITAQHFDWATSGGYSGIANSFFGAIDIARDPQGNCYTIDYGFGNMQCQGDTVSPFSGYTAFIYKFDAQGVLQSISRIGAGDGGSFTPFNIETDETGNLYVLGQLNGVSSLIVNDDTVAATGNSNHLIKIDASGNFIWKHTPSFYSNGQGCMLQYSNGHIYFQSGNLAISKMTTDGLVVTNLTASYYSSPTSSTSLLFKGSEVFPNGDLLFAAYSRGNVAYGTDTLAYTGNPFLTAPILLMRCSDALELDWARYLSNTRDPDHNVIPLAIDADENVYASVQVNSELIIGQDTITGSVSGIGSGTLVKVNGSGDDVWAKMIDNGGAAMGWCMAASSNNTGIFVGGGYTFTAQIGNFSFPNSPGGLPFMAKFDANGNFTNAFSYLSSPTQTDAYCLEPVGDGHYLVGGKLADLSIPVFSCTPINPAKGFYLGSFSEQADTVPTPFISLEGNVLTATPYFDGIVIWYLNGSPIPNETSQTLTVTQSGDYSVEYILTSGCSGSATSLVETVIVSSTATHINTSSVQLFPNPSNGLYSLTNIPNNVVAIGLSVKNVLGAVLYSDAHFNTNQQIDIRHLAQGIYFIDVQLENSIETFKVIKQN